MSAAGGARRAARPREQAREHLRHPRGHVAARRARRRSPRAPASRSRSSRPRPPTAGELRPARRGDEPRGLAVPGDVHVRPRHRRARRAPDAGRPRVRGARQRRRARRGALDDDPHVASIIQREAGSNATTSTRCSRVIQNRLDQGMQASRWTPRSQYGTRQHAHRVDHRRGARGRDATRATPTRTPACRSARSRNPGDVAIDAAMHPADGTGCTSSRSTSTPARPCSDHRRRARGAPSTQLQAWCARATENAAYCE